MAEFHDSGNTGNLARFEHAFGGMLSGMEIGSIHDAGAAGLFGGYSRSRIGIASGAGSTDIDTVFGGANWKRDYVSHHVNLAFAAGATDNDNTRNVGALVANGDYGGWFFAPSL